MLAHENLYWESHPGSILAGVDEAGRGSLAGPVVAAAVAIPRKAAAALMAGELQGLTDSKALSASRRERYFGIIEEHRAVRYGVGEANVDEIERHNILVATGMAMCRAVLALGDPVPDHLLVDGLPMSGLPCSSTSIVGGDRESFLIAAASVVAKVVRDDLMRRLHTQHPFYGWNSNKGYGTRLHVLALQERGASPHHRRTYQPVAAALQPRLEI